MPFSLILPGVTGIADDMVIYGKTDLEHDRTLDQLSQHLQTEHSYAKSRQDAIQVTTGFLLWTSVECQGAQSRSKEGCSSQEDGFA